MSRVNLALVALLIATWSCAPASRPSPQVLAPIASPSAGSGVAVLTQHNDNARSGANLRETRLSPGTIRSGRFGLLFSLPVDGQIYAQPLYAPAIEFPDEKRRNVVFVATMHNSVYAFDADSRAAEPPIWCAHLGASVDKDFFPMVAWYSGRYNIDPEIGITSTPVVDPSAGRIYVVAKIKTHGRRLPFFHWGERVAYRLHALDIRTGKDVDGSPVEIEARVPGWGRGSRFGAVNFDPVRHLQRPGLLLSRGQLYLAFASHQDTEPYHGWILAYDAYTLKQSAVLCTTCTSFYASEGGIWQAGNGPAADSVGNIFVMTGNGTWRQEDAEFGTSFLKLSPDLRIQSWFTPANQPCLNHVDADLGSAGPLLVPNTNLLLGGGKEGVIYLLHRDNLGGAETPGPEHAHTPCNDDYQGIGHPPLASMQAALPYGRNPHIPPFEAIVPSLKSWHYHHIHGSPVFWDTPHGKFIYVWPERDSLRAYRLDDRTETFPGAAPPGQQPRSTFRSAFGNGQGMPGAGLSLSSNGSDPASGVLWAALPKDSDALTQTVPGVLRAFAALPDNVAACDHAPGSDACTLPELWNSLADPSDDIGNFAKYAAPTVVNGRVYAPTFSSALKVYGLRDSAQVAPPTRVASKASRDFATFVRQTAPPANMQPGQRVDVEITMRNSGATSWEPSASTGLLSQNPNGNAAWRRDSIVRLTQRVEPGAEYTFRFVATAPREAIVPFQWRMIVDGVSIGQPSPNVEATVIGPRCAAMREAERKLLAEFEGDTLRASSRDPKSVTTATRLATRLTEIAEQLSKDRCAMSPDATFPNPS